MIYKPISQSKPYSDFSILTSENTLFFYLLNANLCNHAQRKDYTATVVQNLELTYTQKDSTDKENELEENYQKIATKKYQQYKKGIIQKLDVGHEEFSWAIKIEGRNVEISNVEYQTFIDQNNTQELKRKNILLTLTKEELIPARFFDKSIRFEDAFILF